MADHEEEMLAALAYGISRVYTILVDVCGLLPVPIGLPAERHIPVDQAYPAVQRAAELAQDQPMGELQEAQLYTGCILLLAAIDLYALCASTYRETRAEGCGAQLATAEEALKDLYVWLVIQSAD